jgi:hypothetical protein
MHSCVWTRAGLGVRAIMTFISMSGQGYNWKEKVFFAVAWTPKATVQAALSGAPCCAAPCCAGPPGPCELRCMLVCVVCLCKFCSHPAIALFQTSPQSESSFGAVSFTQ